MDTPADPQPQEEKRKPRAQLSCTHCRHKKLKCDRGTPCDQCMKRSQGHLCQYARNKVQSRQVAGPRDMLSRIRYLEDLVLSLKSQNTGSTQPNNIPATQSYYPTPDQIPDQRPSVKPSVNLESRNSPDNESPGTMIVDQVGTRWVDASHWQAILDGITELKDCTESIGRSEGTANTASSAEESQIPSLFAGAFPLASRADILALLPPRTVADRLVSRFFNAKEPGLMIIHIPTFYKEYTEFWDSQEETSIAWIGDPLPGDLGETLLVNKTYRTTTAQCLALADYTKPGQHKVEALVVYFGTEIMKGVDNQLSLSMLLSIIIRLAMHMGYHRDSKHYPNVSVFEGEMKRRVWSLLSQMDHLISFQAGLPRLVPDLQCDTELPHNLSDDDFDETTAELPPARPWTERTNCSYTITKGKLMALFGQITDKTRSMRSEDNQVVQLDQLLREANTSFPPFLRIRKMNLSITDPPDLIMQRYTLELLYQKSRCVLHRKYLTLDRSDRRHAYSREACLDAAMQILRHQDDIYQEVLPGGQLYRDRWFMSSLMSHDFLLAAMILCLEMSQKVDDALGSTPDRYTGVEGRKHMLNSLESSYRIWEDFSAKSEEAKKASKALALMLHNAKENKPAFSQASQRRSRDQQREWQIIGTPVGSQSLFEASQVMELTPSTTFTDQHSNQSNDLSPAGDTSTEAIEGMMDAMMDVGDPFDWDVWDNQVQNNGVDVLIDNGLQPSLLPSYMRAWWQPSE